MAGLLLTVAFMAAAVHGVLVARGHEAGWTGALVKTASVAGLALAGWGLQAPGWIVAGLAFGAVGDFALTRTGERAFLVGMAAFAAGHLAYALGFFLRGADLAAQGGAIWGGWVWLVPVVLLIGSTEAWLAPHTGRLRGPVRLYGVVIGVMAAVVALLPDHGGVGMLRIGAALFVVSDLMLAVRLFRVKDAAAARVLSALLWPCYWAGQALILTGGLVYGAGPG